MPHLARGLKIAARDRKAQIDNGSRKTVTDNRGQNKSRSGPSLRKRKQQIQRVREVDRRSRDRATATAAITATGASPRKHRTPSQLWDQPLGRKPEVAGWRSVLNQQRAKSRPCVRMLHPTQPTAPLTTRVHARALNANLSLYRQPTPATGACNAVLDDMCSLPVSPAVNRDSRVRL